MKTGTQVSSHQRGFTLVELVVAICIATIVAAFMVVFIRTPVENYIAESRRAELITEADLIERSLSQDIRGALPNSTRNTGTLLEMIPVVDMAVYRAVGTELPAVANDELAFGAPDGNFRTLGAFNQTAVPPPCCTNRFQIIIGQDQSSPASDIYRGGSVITPSSTTITLAPQIPRSDSVTLSAPFTFTSPSLNKHLYLVKNPVGGVAYECNTVAGTLKRYVGYSLANGVAANRNLVNGATISNDVSFCTFNRTPGSKTRGDLVTINIRLTRAGETQTVFVQQAVENLP